MDQAIAHPPRSQYSERRVPDILHGPQSTDKETHPAKIFMLSKIVKGFAHALLADFYEITVFQHKHHKESIGKNDERKNKI